MQRNKTAGILALSFTLVFAIFWTIMAVNITGMGAGGSSVGVIFLLFGIIIITVSIIRMVHAINYKERSEFNTSTNTKKYSSYRTANEVKASTEQYKKIDREINGGNSHEHEYSVETNDNYFNSTSDGSSRVCPLCGAKVSSIDTKCPSCKSSI